MINSLTRFSWCRSWCRATRQCVGHARGIYWFQNALHGFFPAYQLSLILGWLFCHHMSTDYHRPTADLWWQTDQTDSDEHPVGISAILTWYMKWQFSRLHRPVCCPSAPACVLEKLAYSPWWSRHTVPLSQRYWVPHHIDAGIVTRYQPRPASSQVRIQHAHCNAWAS